MDGFKRPRRPVTPRPTPSGNVGSGGASVRHVPQAAVAQPRSVQRVVTAPPRPQPSRPVQPPSSAASQPDSSRETSAKRSRSTRFSWRHRWMVLVAITIALFVAALAAYGWYQQQLQPVDATDNSVQRVEIKDGTTFALVSSSLKDRGLIRNTTAFDIYARLSGQRDSVKAGTCSLKPSMPSADILKKIVAGCHDFKSITFFPGATIEKPLYKPASATLDQTMYVKYVLKSAGYTDQQITEALAKQYSSPIFAGKPSGSTLEGYIFGETYYVPKDASAEEVLQETFKQFDKIITQDDLVAKFKALGLDLFQGITMASIVQRELNCEGKPTQARKLRCYNYQRMIAQIFLKRLKENISLGSDVTFIYAADMMGVTPSVDLDSPYNTRKHPGLPPGPIAAPGELALKAVANPTDTDYLFFIAGDDGLIYFAKDQAGHEANIKNHCQQLCNEL